MARERVVWNTMKPPGVWCKWDGGGKKIKQHAGNSGHKGGGGIYPQSSTSAVEITVEVNVNQEVCANIVSPQQVEQMLYFLYPFSPTTSLPSRALPKQLFMGSCGRLNLTNDSSPSSNLPIFTNAKKPNQVNNRPKMGIGQKRFEVSATWWKIMEKTWEQ